MHRITLSLLACASALLAMASMPQIASAQDAINEPVGHGNQAWGGTLGIDFTVNSSLSITALGAYNNTGNAFVNAKTVQIWNINNTVAPVISLTINPGDSTFLSNGFRYESIAPLTLLAGNYTVDAYGFDGSDLNYNTNVNGTALVPTLDTFGGAVTWVPNSNGDGTIRNRYGFGSEYPSVTNDGAQWYLANGSFEASPVPESSSLFLLLGGGGGLTSIMALRRRFSRKSA